MTLLGERASARQPAMEAATTRGALPWESTAQRHAEAAVGRGNARRKWDTLTHAHRSR